VLALLPSTAALAAGHRIQINEINYNSPGPDTGAALQMRPLRGILPGCRQKLESQLTSKAPLGKGATSGSGRLISGVPDVPNARGLP